MKLSITTFFLSLIAFTGIAQQATPDIIQTAKGGVTIQPIMHASLVLSMKGLTIYADPTGGAAKYAGLGSPNLILITDIHGDHFDPATIAAVRTANTVLIVPKAVADKMPDSLKAKMVIVNNGGMTTQSGISISAIPMYNLPEAPMPNIPRVEGMAIYSASAGRISIFPAIPRAYRKCGPLRIST